MAPGEHRLPQLTSAILPDGVEDAAIRSALLERHRIEIGGGLGALAGTIWRIGMMGYGATTDAAERVLAAIDDCLATV